MHAERSPLAGKIIRIKDNVSHPQIPDFGGNEYVVEDWWDHLTGGSWMDAKGNPACIVYAIRTGFAEHEVPTDDEVLYGKIGSYGHLLHISEIEEV
jgi:hypothetical protein